MAVDSRWVRHLSDKSLKDKFHQALVNDTLVLGRLLAILEEELEVLNRTEVTEKTFEDPNWSHKVAFYNGEKARLRKTIALLNFLKD